MVYSGNGNYSNTYFQQTCDIDLSAYYWQPIGIKYDRSSTRVDRPFLGSYDGGGHTISGVYTKSGTGDAYSYQGLFGYRYRNTGNYPQMTISNLGIVDSYIQGNMYVGGIVGYIHDNNTDIKNCYNTGRVSGNNYVGGILGSGEYGGAAMNNCYNAGSVVISGSSVYQGGGIVGYCHYSTIYNCFNVGSVSSGSGEIVGMNNGATNNCYHNGEKGVASGTDTTTKSDTLTTDAKTKTWYTNSSKWDSTYPWDFDTIWTIDTSKNDGYPTFKFKYNFQGEGTSVNSPYQISTEEDLRALATMANEGNNFSGKYLKQTADLYMGGQAWTPIGNSSRSFRGNFNGGNYTISGLYVESDIEEVGLFGDVGSSGTIKNVNIKDSTFISTYASSSSFGGIVGYADSNTIITNCSVKNTTFTQEGYGHFSAGGIVGKTANATISDCVFEGTISGSGQNVGGIAGSLGGSIENCQSFGNLSSTYDTMSYVGGIAGNASNSLAKVNKCVFNGTVKGAFRIGSISGTFYGKEMTNCAGYGTVHATSSSAQVGGICGNIDASMSNCSFVGSSNIVIGAVYGAKGSSATLTACYSQINGKGSYTSGDFSGFTVVPNMNSDLPMQNALYSIAIGGQSSEYVINHLKSKGFTLVS